MTSQNLTAVTSVPSNCRFECSDINEGLSRYKNSFDVIHLRYVLMGIKDTQDFLAEAYGLLRPGGILLIVDGELMHGEDKKILLQDDIAAPVSKVFGQLSVLTYR